MKNAILFVFGACLFLVLSQVFAADDPSKLAEDFAAATAMACQPTSEKNPAPIDPLACQCNRFITAALPTLKPADGDVKGVFSAAERVRVFKIRAGQSTFKTEFQMN